MEDLTAESDLGDEIVLGSVEVLDVVQLLGSPVDGYGSDKSEPVGIPDCEVRQVIQDRSHSTSGSAAVAHFGRG